ncbi:hypothetical protein [Desulfallas thermosapovorans]|uniref:Uncharacterized protein n=1 Tax=Desulfallas thermosapovorans DSM 6562 TaxID=1121431 RepID=A0A5S4ZQ15_9FIRM|nr:hypothetical protein [Desulfallas thermosapovorans]TYO94761.1 hypothetical protein LX24_02230 [Desulfallas thermosapovorans DSM 6562]
MAGMVRHFGIGLLIYEDIIDWDNYESKVDPVMKMEFEFDGVRKKVYEVIIVPVDRPYVGIILPSLWGKIRSAGLGGHEIELDDVDPRSIGVSVYALDTAATILNKISTRKISLKELELRFYEYWV